MRDSVLQTCDNGTTFILIAPYPLTPRGVGAPAAARTRVANAGRRQSAMHCCVWAWQEASSQPPVETMPASTEASTDWDWLSGFMGESKRALTVEVGQTVRFTNMQGHNIVVVPSKAAFDACSFANDAAVVTPSAESTYTWTAPSQAGLVYLVCGVGTHCIAGQKLAVTVALIVPTATDAPVSVAVVSAASPAPAGAPASPAPLAAASALSSAPATVKPSLAPSPSSQRISSIGCGQQLAIAAGWLCFILSTLCVAHGCL